MAKWLGLLALICATQVNAGQALFGPTRNGVQIVCADVNEEGVTATDLLGIWILGFWSGLNAAKNARVGETTTANGVVAEVKLYCSTHPSVTLAQATFDTYGTMRDARRK